MCGETLDQFFFYVLQSSAEKERERDSTFTTEVNTLTYLNKSIDHLYEDDT